MEYNTTIEVNLSTRPDSIALALSLEYEWCNDGIGSYEYWGSVEYDHGTDYVDINEVTYDKAGFTPEEIAEIELTIEEHLSSLTDEIAKQRPQANEDYDEYDTYDPYDIEYDR